MKHAIHPVHHAAVWVVFAVVLVVSNAALAAGLGEPFSLAVGEGETVGRVAVTFDGVSDDGRCPIGLLCFWEGDAACALSVRVNDDKPVRLTVHTSSMFGREVNYGGHTIALTTLEPYPVYLSPPPPASYVVTLVVTAQVPTDTESSTWGRIKALYAGN